MNLRPYQKRGIERLKESLKSGNKRPVLQAATGAGKTILSAAIIKAAQEKGNKVIFTAPAISLIDQTVSKLYDAEIYDVGVIQADHPLTDFSKPVQVASVQTLMRRKIPAADLVIIDEAHLCFEFIYKWMQSEDWRSVPFIGLSATPWARAMGAPDRWDDLIVAATIEELTREGYLASIRYLAPDVPDLSGIKTVAGDYHEGQLAEKMRTRELLSNSVDKWIELGEDRPTIAFCVDCAHAQDMQRRFIECGIPCGYIDGRTEAEERKEIGKQLDRGEIKVVTSVGCLIVGLDWTFVSCILHARPTKSTMLYIQSIGRGLRLHEGKENCLVLDCAGNYRHGHPYDIHYTKLDDGSPKAKQERKEKEMRVLEPVECKSCYAIRPPRIPVCPICGFEAVKQTEVIEGDADLVEVCKGGKVKRKKKIAARDWPVEKKQDFYSGLLAIQGERGYSQNWASMNFKEKFGEFPKEHGVREITAKEAAPAVRSWVQHRMIKYAKSKKKLEAAT